MCHIPLSSPSAEATFYFFLLQMTSHQRTNEWHDVHLYWRLEVASLMLEKAVHFLSRQLERRWLLRYQGKENAASLCCAEIDDRCHSTQLGTACNKQKIISVTSFF